MTKQDEKKYDDSIKELELIIGKMQGGAMSMTEYIEQARRAKQLLEECKAHLNAIDEDISGIFDDNAKNSTSTLDAVDGISD